MKMNPRVDTFMKKEKNWHDEFEVMREIALASGLTEDLKWGQPCYTLEGKNVFLIHGFKNYCAFLFFKGALMKDPEKILIRQTEEVQGPRQIRFTDKKEIVKLKKVLKAYMKEAIRVEESGEQLPKKSTATATIPANIQSKMRKFPGLLVSFKKLTPGRQRAYLLHFTGAKQEATVISRIEKCAPAILAGKGLNE
jgi:uncharacterized protein YdeI (YjbR/CyaY-like superfamily)